jgi:hypothetical protein
MSVNQSEARKIMRAMSDEPLVTWNAVLLLLALGAGAALAVALERVADTAPVTRDSRD